MKTGDGLKRFLLTYFLLLSFAFGAAAKETGEVASIVISPSGGSVKVGDKLNFTAEALDESGEPIRKTKISWSASGGVGDIKDNGLFTATAPGEGLVTATAGSESESVSVTVTAPEESPPPGQGPDGNNGNGPPEEPGDDTPPPDPDPEPVPDPSPGPEPSPVPDPEPEPTPEPTPTPDPEPTPSPDPEPTPTPDPEPSPSPTPSPEPTPEPSPAPDPAPTPPPGDTSFTVSFLREKDNGKTSGFGPAVAEGGTATISGFHSPLNFLNGMELFFPQGSLTEDISILLRLPGFVPLDDAGEAAFSDGVLMAVEFEVRVDDTPIAPYRFPEPIRLTIPYQPPLLEKLGVDPADLQLFYLTADGDLDGEGIENVVVDTVNERIVCEVEYFNIIALTLPDAEPVMSVQPSSLDFGEVALDGTVSEVLEIANTGTGALEITGIESDNTAFTVDPATAIIPPQGSAQVTVTFAPGEYGDYSGAITVAGDDPVNSLLSVAVSGSCAGARMRLPDTTLAFGEVAVGETSTERFDISNTGNRELVIASIESGDPAFSVEPSSGVIPPGETMSAAITFAPTARGDHAAEIAIECGDGSTGAVAITGTAISPGIAVEPASLDFGEVALDWTVSEILEIANTGTGALEITGIESDNTAFTVDTATAIIPPQGSAQVTVTFAPGEYGDYSGAITVAGDDPVNSLLSVAVSGSCAGARMRLPDTTLAFGEVAVGETSTERFDISNTGNRELVIASIESGDPAFSVEPSSGVIPPGETMSAAITFAPTARGDHAAEIAIECGDGSTGAVAITGTAISPGIAVEPASLDFGVCLTGETAMKTITVANTGNAPLTITGISIDDPAFTAELSGDTVEPGSTAEIIVSYAPAAAREHDAALVIESSDPDAPILHVPIAGAADWPRKVDVSLADVNGGGTVTLNDCPWPYDFLNGLTISFPGGSLDNGVGISLKLPSSLTLDEANGGVTFSPDILTAVAFEVVRDGEVISPYYFKKPVTLALPFDTDRLNDTGWDPGDLRMYFKDGGPFDSQGIGAVSVDHERGVISATVAHFSEIVVSSVEQFTLTGMIWGADGVTVTLDGDSSASMVVNSGHYYQFSVDKGGTYNVTASKEGYTFTPDRAIFAKVSADQAIDMTAEPDDSQTDTEEPATSPDDTGDPEPDDGTDYQTGEEPPADTAAPDGPDGDDPDTRFDDDPANMPPTGTPSNGSDDSDDSNEDMDPANRPPPATPGSGSGDTNDDPAPVDDGGPDDGTVDDEPADDDSPPTEPDPTPPPQTEPDAGDPGSVPSGDPVDTPDEDPGEDDDTPVTRPSMKIGTSSIDLGAVPVGRSSAASFTLENSGDGELVVHSIASDNDAFSVIPSSVVVAPGGSEKVTVTFRPESAGGQHGEITIESNDPDAPTFIVAVTGTGAVSSMTVSPQVLSIGYVETGARGSAEFVISNPGRSALTVEDIVCGDPRFSVDANGFAIPPGDSWTVTVFFEPDVKGARNCAVTIISDASENGTATVDVSAVGVEMLEYTFSVRENESLVVFGIQYPLDFLNGMKIHFPEGSLAEEISLSLELPGFARVLADEGEVLFGGDILAAVSIDVSVDGRVIEPYHFNTPVEVTLPYDEESLAELGLDPFDLGLFFVTDEGELDGDGVSDIVVDPDRRTVTASVAHFSTIALAEKPPEPVAVETGTPARFTLAQNVPNPFNAATVIGYELAEDSRVRIDVFSVIGQRVTTLEDGFRAAGRHSVVWNGTSDDGANLPSGVYLYRIRAGEFTDSNKLMLLR